MRNVKFKWQIYGNDISDVICQALFDMQSQEQCIKLAKLNAI